MVFQDYMQTAARLFQAKKFAAIRQFITYVFFGGISACIDIAIMVALTEVVGLWYFYAAFFSFIVGTTVNYILNKYANFKNKSKKIASQYSVYLIIATSALAINQTLLYVLVEFVGLWYVFAKIVAIGCIGVGSFLGHKYLTFSEKFR